MTLGAMLYRAGRYEEAARHLDEFIAAYPAYPSPGEASINYLRLLQSMTKWQLEDKDEARRLLAEAQSSVAEELQSSSISWNRRATLEVLRREAENFIGQKDADVAVENGELHRSASAINNDE
jgi:tetratricopeptide (TPR) repeat protein